MNSFFEILRKFKNLIPFSHRHYGRYILRHRKNLWRWLHIWRGGNPGPEKIRVFYGHDHVPGPEEEAYGGMVKFQRIQKMFSNTVRRFNILYMVNNWRPKDWEALIWLTEQKKAKIVCNQDGVAYPAWCPSGWEKRNRAMATFLHAADYVVYQSEFSKVSADHFLGEPKKQWEILYNAVDTTAFTPASSDPDTDHLVLLLGGNQYSYYRIETAIRTIAILKKQRADVRLLITGKLSWIPDEQEAFRIIGRLIGELGLTEYIQFLGFYKQREAPEVLKKAHILLHTKYNDPCPELVLEAMASGLPVVYSASGGTPELVGDEAGIGIPAELSWETAFPPDPQALADAVLRIAEHRTKFAEAARQRAVQKFDLQPWLQRHREIFEELLHGLRY